MIGRQRNIEEISTIKQITAVCNGLIFLQLIASITILYCSIDIYFKMLDNVVTRKTEAEFRERKKQQKTKWEKEKCFSFVLI